MSTGRTIVRRRGFTIAAPSPTALERAELVIEAASERLPQLQEALLSYELISSQVELDRVLASEEETTLILAGKHFRTPYRDMGSRRTIVVLGSTTLEAWAEMNYVALEQATVIAYKGQISCTDQAQVSAELSVSAISVSGQAKATVNVKGGSYCHVRVSEQGQATVHGAALVEADDDASVSVHWPAILRLTGRSELVEATMKAQIAELGPEVRVGAIDNSVTLWDADEQQFISRDSSLAAVLFPQLA